MHSTNNAFCMNFLQPANILQTFFLHVTSGNLPIWACVVALFLSAASLQREDRHYYLIIQPTFPVSSFHFLSVSYPPSTIPFTSLIPSVTAKAPTEMLQGRTRKKKGDGNRAKERDVEGGSDVQSWHHIVVSLCRVSYFQSLYPPLSSSSSRLHHFSVSSTPGWSKYNWLMCD